ncbi:MAG: DUF4317 domain-containing protein [Eubacteriales bacterium]|nr:DUF4317 domain-containing protein [Eubacteriales bacterium]
MTRKEMNEIKSQFSIDDCGILKLCGCYVDGEKNKVTKINETFLNLPEEERHKYFDIFKKTLSGTPGKNLIDMKFTTDSYSDEGARSFLIKLRDSGLKDEAILDEFYDKVISSYYYPGNYIILLINQIYDIPSVTADNIEMEDGSEEVYSYILCSICHVTLSKPGLGYFEEENAFHNRVQSHMVDVPDIGFLFPSFSDRSADEDQTLFYSKDADDFQQNFLNTVLDCEVPLPAGHQKETFNTLVTETLGDECDYETIKNIHDNLNEIIDEHKAVSCAPVMLDKTEVKELLEKSGVQEEKLADFEEHFEMAAGEEGKLVASNIAATRKFEVKTPDVVVKVNPDKTDLVETRIIDGRQCLVIQIDERLEVNGISVNPHTGEVIERNNL